VKYANLMVKTKAPFFPIFKHRRHQDWVFIGKSPSEAWPKDHFSGDEWPKNTVSFSNAVNNSPPDANSFRWSQRVIGHPRLFPKTVPSSQTTSPKRWRFSCSQSVTVRTATVQTNNFWCCLTYQNTIFELRSMNLRTLSYHST
jgi:hypothetical protein